MRQAIINQAASRERGQHPGLVLHRFLIEQDNPEERRALLRAAIAASKNPALVKLYTLAYQRWRDGLPKPPVGIIKEADLKTAGRLIVGLGEESVLETGVRLHHTYGVPLIPGTALKGIASHYCDHVWGQRHLGGQAREENQGFRRGEIYHRLLFGNTEDGGAVRFEDAWLEPNSLTAAKEGLLPDIMTPHHPDWQTSPAAPPTDFDNPRPVAYLSVAGRFHLALSWQGPANSTQADPWTELALNLLKESLCEWGVGGKTSSGYGRLIDAQRGQAPADRATRVESSLAARPAATAGKRDHGTPATVQILAPRSGGFDVKEEGRPAGVLNQGKAPTPLPEVGATIEVYVFNDDPRKPQYRWDRPQPSQPPRRQRPGGRGGSPRGGRR
jgi:CRISPR-associated protein Cmr6